jgi:putative restriction endonuclease
LQNIDTPVRVAAFDWLTEQVDLHGDVLPRILLSDGFLYEGTRVPLLGPQGIFKPRLIPEIPLSITTAPNGPYDDGMDPGGRYLRYRYRGKDPQHRDNVGLRKAAARQVPLIYFFGVVPGKYLALWPVYIVGDDPASLTFTVAVDDLKFQARGLSGVAEPTAEARRAYITATVRQRVHQRAFRERVLRAYREQCALCRLRHSELLDAAHIIPDADPEGEPVVSNGLALCKLHHAAFDRSFLGVRPDYIVEVKASILEEEDGPMLLHGLKGLHRQRIEVPRNATLRPNPKSLAKRFERFLAG